MPRIGAIALTQEQVNSTVIIAENNTAQV